ncbi:hypothetical protein HYPSUDRAFT_141354, partial [Hypholoma sublateritium FD-334 SS-4]
GYSRGNIRQYCDRWTGYGPAVDSWISDHDLRNAPEVKRNACTTCFSRLSVHDSGLLGLLYLLCFSHYSS